MACASFAVAFKVPAEEPFDVVELGDFEVVTHAGLKCCQLLRPIGYNKRVVHVIGCDAKRNAGALDEQAGVERALSVAVLQELLLAECLEPLAAALFAAVDGTLDPVASSLAIPRIRW